MSAPIAHASAGGGAITVGVGGTAPPAVATPLDVTTNGYGPGMSVGEDGTTHVAWNEPQANFLDTVRYCRVARPTATCADPETFTPAGHVTPSSETRFNRDGAHPVIVLTPRPDTVVLITTRYREFQVGALAVGADGQIGACGNLNPCHDSSNPVFAYVSTDNGATFSQRVIGEQRGGVVAATTMTVDDGTPAERDLILLFGDQNRLNVTSANTFTEPCADLASPGGNLPAEASIATTGRDAVVAFNQGDSVFVRRFSATPEADGAETIRQLCNVERWGTWQTLEGFSSARVAGGPRGFPMLTDRTAGISRQRVVRQLLGAGGGTNEALGRTHNDTVLRGLGDIAQDGAGGAAAVWIDPRQTSGSTVGHDLQLATAASGSATFLAPTTLRSIDDSTGNSSAEDVLISVLDDGGGAVAVQRNGAPSPAPSATITVYLFGTRAVRPISDVQLAGVEVSQVVQQADPLTRSPRNPGAQLAYQAPGTISARLIQGKPTILRAYVNMRTAIAAGGALPAVILRVRRDGRDILTLRPFNPPNGLPAGDAFTVDPVVHTGLRVAGTPALVPPPAPPAPPATLPPRANQVYTFTIPPVGDFARYSYELEANPPTEVPAFAECRQCRGVDNFLRVGPQTFWRPTTVNIRPIELQVGSTDAQRPARARLDNSPTQILNTARALLPVNLAFPPYLASFNLSDIAREDDSADDRQDEGLEIVEEWADDTEDRSGLFPIGIYPFNGNNFGFNVPQVRMSDGYWMRGGKSSNNDGLDCVFDCTDALYQDRQPIAILGDSPPRALTEAAHEIVHGLGFKHAGTNRGCYTEESQIGEAWPFGDDGKIDGIGIDPRSGMPPYNRIFSDPTQGNGATVYDMMSYCPGSGPSSGNWVSLFNWNRISGYFAPPQAASASVRASASAARAAAAPRVARSLLVTARVPASETGGEISSVRSNRHAPVSRAQSNKGPYAIVAYDATGKSIFVAAAERRGSLEGGPADFVRGYVPVAGVRRVDVVRVSDNAVLATRTASRSTPTMSITSPKRGATVGAAANVTVRWNASDADGDRLEQFVEYAANGTTYRPIAYRGEGSSLSIPSRLFSRSSRARLRIRVNDGFNERSATVGPFRALGSPPIIQVLAPLAPGAPATGRADVSMTLQAAAFDDTNRPLAANRIKWKLGRRTVLSRADGSVLLPAGRQRLTVEATDRARRVGRRTVIINVAGAQPKFLRITGPARVRPTARKVTLKIAAAFPSTLTVQRRHIGISRTPVNVSVNLPRRGARTTVTLTLRSGALSQVARVVITRR